MMAGRAVRKDLILYVILENSFKMAKRGINKI
jgi:hypothetical protein